MPAVTRRRRCRGARAACPRYRGATQQRRWIPATRTGASSRWFRPERASRSRSTWAPADDRLPVGVDVVKRLPCHRLCPVHVALLMVPGEGYQIPETGRGQTRRVNRVVVLERRSAGIQDGSYSIHGAVNLVRPKLLRHLGTQEVPTCQVVVASISPPTLLHGSAQGIRRRPEPHAASRHYPFSGAGLHRPSEAARGNVNQLHRRGSHRPRVQTRTIPHASPVIRYCPGAPAGFRYTSMPSSMSPERFWRRVNALSPPELSGIRCPSR